MVIKNFSKNLQFPDKEKKFQWNVNPLTRKTFSKGSIQQMCVIPQLELLIVLCEKVVQVHNINTLQLLDTLENERVCYDKSEYLATFEKRDKH